MNGHGPQPPQNWWEATLDLFRWACRIPAALLGVFAISCLVVLAGISCVRFTVWVIQNWLAHPW